MSSLFLSEWAVALPVWALCMIYAAVLCLSVIVIGFLMDRFEVIVYRLLSKHMSNKMAHILIYRVTWPGTAIHELSHALVGWMLGARILKIKIFEFKGNQLGHVEFQCRGSKRTQMVQLGLLSCAPVLTGCLLLYLLIVYGLNPVRPWYVIAISAYLLVCVVIHMSMSGQDIKNYMKSMWVVYPLMICIVYLVRLSVINI